eukprot:TRINITY_DN3773_c0_g1_i5.p1 TRINITY_DN3773_c0_g1~~TRINITY_DN3773_c0_g1_i5.p1  ORF type:complete len:139 (+),score=27.05 TRINITY_DN3773_c0_g1_i5:60-476(+)
MRGNSVRSDCGSYDAAPSPSAGPPAPTSCGLLLYVSLPRSDASVAVDLPVDGTLGSLKQAVREAGGPAVGRQLLSIGGEVLTGADSTPLSDVSLMASEVTVAVGFARHPAAEPRVLSVDAFHAAVLLEGGEGLDLRGG